MLASNTFDATSTTTTVQCDHLLSGLERILVTCQGDLQRILSAFFDHSIAVECVYRKTGSRAEAASPSNPITQDRQVLLKCRSHTVCVATSTVVITCPEVERLFLDEQYPIGQLFRKLGVPPQFHLQNVNVSYPSGFRELERTYQLSTEGVSCTILEVFPDANLFVKGIPSEIHPMPSHTDIGDSVARFTSDVFFTKVPRSPLDTPTLSSVLDQQALDSIVGHRIFACYPHFDRHGGRYKEITYSQLARTVDHEACLWSRSLRPYTHGVDPPIVAVLADSSFEYAVTLLSLMKLNLSVFLLAPANSEAAISHLLNSCQAAAIICSLRYFHIGTFAAASLDIPVFILEDFKVYEIDDVISGRHPLSVPKPLHTSPPDVPIIVHSSGSTAFPKPVRWSQKSFFSNGQVLLSDGGWSVFTDPDNRFLCLGPLFHTLGLTTGLANTICAGTTIVFPLTRTWPPSPTDIANSLRLSSATTCVIVPLLLEQLVGVLEDENSATPLQLLSNLRLLFIGGAHCPKSLAHRLVNAGVNLKCIYGSSETGHLLVGSHDPSTTREDSWDLMRPFPHTSVVFKPLVGDFGVDNMYQVHLAKEDVRLAPHTIRDDSATWSTGDVVEESPPGSGWYRLLYRDDDILVHVSGEKTNPIPMEITCREHKLIDSVAIIGHQRRVTAAVVQLVEPYARQFTEVQRLTMIHEAIDAANREAPRHSRVLQEMVFVIPLGYGKSLPRTPKGNCIRPKVLQQFADEIDALYRNFEDDNDSQGGSSSASSVTVIDVQNQILPVLEDVVGYRLKSGDYERSFFDMGLDSVKAMQLRTRLAKSFSTKLPQKFIYQHFTLSNLSAALSQQLSSRSSTPLPALSSSPSPVHPPSRNETLDSLIKSQVDILANSAQFLQASRLTAGPRSPTEHVVGVVGAAGSLGVWQVKSLLDQANVKQVVCLVRGKDVAAVYDKMVNGFQHAKLTGLAQFCEACKESQTSQPDVPATSLRQRLVVVPFDLGQSQLVPSEYYALASTLTTIIHTGWKMDFNQVVQGFQDCIQGTTRLLILAAFLRPKQFYFISSIGTVLESIVTPVPETLPPWTKDDPVRASPHGYSESKFVCEYVIEAASRILDIPCSIARIGQISGDSVSGVWKVQEMNPIIIAGSARIRKFPVASGAIMDWIPVDTVGQTTAELATAEKTPSASFRVHHIVNPSPSTYGQLVHHLNSLGLCMEPVSPRDWWEAIHQDEGNPCLAIESYIEEAVVEAFERLGDEASVTLDVTNTLDTSTSLSSCPPVDDQLWEKCVSYWRSIGFLN